MIEIQTNQGDLVPDTANMDWLLFKVDGINGNVKWDGSSWTQMGIDAPTGTATVSSAGSGSLAATWAYAMTYYNSGTDYESNGMYLGSVTTTSASATSITGIPVSSDSQVDYKKIYRTTDGGGVYYYLKTIDGSATSTTDKLSDATIDTDNTLPTTHGVPYTARYCHVHKRHMFLAGDGEEGRGYITLAATTSVVGRTSGSGQTYFREDMAGKFFSARNEIERYTISSVDTATQTLTLSSAYAGTSGTATFAITGDPNRFQASEANMPEAFANTYSLPLDADKITGLGSLYDDMFIFTKKKVYMWGFEIDPDPVTGSGTLVEVNAAYGCDAFRTITNVENSLWYANLNGVYVLGARPGVTSGYEVSDISAPIRNRWRDNLSKAYFNRSHAFYRRADNSYYIWVNEDIYDDDVFQVSDAQKIHPNTLYAFNLDTKTWTRHANMIAASSIRFLDSDGDEHVLFDDGLGNVMEYGVGSYDAYNGAGSVASATSTTLTDTSATFPTTGRALRGAPVRIESGTGEGQIRRILSNTTTTLTIETAWGTNPGATSTYSIGAVDTLWRSKMEDFGTGDNAKLVKTFNLSHSVASTTGTTVKVRFLEGADLTPVVPTASWTRDGVTITSGDPWYVIDLTHGDGNIVIETSFNSRYVTVEFDGHEPGKPFELLGYSFKYKERLDK